MVKVHCTRLMREGEVVLWNKGAVAWRGLLGAVVTDVRFDCVSIHVAHEQKLRSLLNGLGTEDVLAAIAVRWCGEDA
jgi:hypothetical protein